jgi:hypothetical protein
MIRGQRNSKVRRILKPLAFDKQFDEAIDRFRQHRQNVEDEARTCHMIEAAEQRDAQLVLFAEERRRNLLARLSKVNSKHRHRKLKDSRHEGTGVWFTSCPEYQEWQAAEQSSVLCCYGIREYMPYFRSLKPFTFLLIVHSRMWKICSRVKCYRFLQFQ